MTDNDRDQIDQDAQIFMRTCSEAIKQLRNEGVSFYFCATNQLKWKFKHNISRNADMVLFILHAFQVRKS